MNAIVVAAGILGTLTGAGLTDGEIHWWMQRPRDELDGRSPREAVLEDPNEVLELARSDKASGALA